MGYDGEKGSVPRVVKDAAQYLRQTGDALHFSANQNLTYTEQTRIQVCRTKVSLDVPQRLLCYVQLKKRSIVAMSSH